MTEGIIQAQAVIFLFAGYETTSTLLSFACAIFCEYPEIQDKLRKEIMEASKNSRNCTYDMLADMPYMEKVILGKIFVGKLCILISFITESICRNIENVPASYTSR